MIFYRPADAIYLWLQVNYTDWYDNEYADYITADPFTIFWDSKEARWVFDMFEGTVESCLRVFWMPLDNTAVGRTVSLPSRPLASINHPIYSQTHTFIP